MGAFRAENDKFDEEIRIKWKLSVLLYTAMLYSITTLTVDPLLGAALCRRPLTLTTASDVCNRGKIDLDN